MAKHRLNRRKPSVEPKVKSSNQSVAPKRKPKAHSKSYYKPKVPSVKANTTKSITPTNIKSEIKKQAKIQRRAERKAKRQFKTIKKKARKLYRELRREQKALARQHSKVRYPAKYTVELDVSRETSEWETLGRHDHFQAKETPYTGEIPTEATWQPYGRDEDLRTEETPVFDDINYAIDDYIDMIQMAHDDVQTKWSEYGDYFTHYDIASGLLNAIFWLEQAKALPYESKEAIMKQLESSQDLDRVRDIMFMRDYNDIVATCEDIANTIMSVVESVRG